MNTLENNKLIAEFMNLNLYNSFWYKSNIATEKKICKENNLKFHSDWNWLMKAVKRIDEISLNAPTIWNLEGKTNDIFISMREVNIELTYNRVIDFINFYNNQNRVS